MTIYKYLTWDFLLCSALFSNLLYQIDYMYFIFDLLSSILATNSLKSNHCELGFFCPLIGTDRSRAGEAALNSAWMLRVEYGERILASQHFFLKTLSSSSVPLLSEEETYVYTNVQSLFLNGIFVNDSPFLCLFFWTNEHPCWHSALCPLG